jgi:hypothetical protein
LDDFDTLRWCVRWDGQAGFLFFSNRQPTVPLADHPAVQFALKTADGTELIPSQPIDIANGSYGLWPINLDCDGVKLDYATAQPLCRLANGNAVWYFFAALDGIPAELSLTADASTVTVDHGQKETAAGHLLVHQIPPSLNRAVSVATANGGSVNFVVLMPEQAREFYRLPFAGKDRAFLTEAAVMPDGNNLRLQALDTKDLTLSVFPPVIGAKTKPTAVFNIANPPEGIFPELDLNPPPEPDKIDVTLTQVQPAGPNGTSLKGMDDATWNDAAVYQVNIPPAAAGRRVIMKIHYMGDAIRVYVGDKLFDDNFYNGDPLSIALWRIPADQWPNIRLKILPYSDGLADRLPPQATDLVAKAKASSSLDEVTAEAVEQVELTVSPP